ncbi:MAG: NUDIX hydrolase [Anaerolineae bacterium]
MSAKWEVLAREELLDGSPWIRVYRETVRLEDGRTVVPDFYQVVMPDFVVIFAVMVDGRVVTIEQYRHAVRAVTIELPAGVIDAGEDAAAAAQRELLEEAGLQADRWESLGSFVVDPNRGCGRGYIFLALGARHTSAPDDSGELQRQRVRLHTPEELRRIWLGGGIANMSTSAAIGLGLARLDQDGIAG